MLSAILPRYPYGTLIALRNSAGDVIPVSNESLLEGGGNHED